MARLTIIAALILGALAAPAAASTPVIGVGEQRADIFWNPHFRELGLRHVRLVVPWDVLHYRDQRREIDAWMAAAEMAGARPLVSFGRSRRDGKHEVLPTAKRFRREFLALHRRYPIVRDWVAWNEANHCSQPTCTRPDRAARYHDIIRRACPKCSVVAADVLDQPNMVPWLKEFKRHVQVRPKIWGLHNYLDANRFRTTGTRALLRTVRGQVWFTETGGVVRKPRSNHRLRQNTRHAAKATRWVFRLARLSPRINRVYFYHWQPAAVPWATWDSALLDPHGRPRPAFKVLRAHVRRIAAAKRG